MNQVLHKTWNFLTKLIHQDIRPISLILKKFGYKSKHS